MRSQSASANINLCFLIVTRNLICQSCFARMPLSLLVAVLWIFTLLHSATGLLVLCNASTCESTAKKKKIASQIKHELFCHIALPHLVLKERRIAQDQYCELLFFSHAFYAKASLHVAKCFYHTHFFNFSFFSLDA